MAKKKQKKANAQQGRGDAGVAYLSYHGPGERSIGGIGDFAKGKEPVAVENSIARQYESKDMRALGWRVEWRDVGASGAGCKGGFETRPYRGEGRDAS